VSQGVRGADAAPHMCHLQSMGLIKANESWTTYDADDVVAGLQVRSTCRRQRCMQLGDTTFEAPVCSSTQRSRADHLGILLPSQEFLICIEMFVAALAHAYAFPPSDYTDPLHPPQGMVSARFVPGDDVLCQLRAITIVEPTLQ
jgi:Organic solute transporter Ostalpha